MACLHWPGLPVRLMQASSTGVYKDRDMHASACFGGQYQRRQVLSMALASGVSHTALFFLGDVTRAVEGQLPTSA